MNPKEDEHILNMDIEMVSILKLFIRSKWYTEGSMLF